MNETNEEKFMSGAASDESQGQPGFFEDGTGAVVSTETKKDDEKFTEDTVGGESWREQQ